MEIKTVLLDELAVKRALKRISHEIVENNKGVSNIVLLVLLAGIIAFFSISYIIVDEKNFSEDENRYLQTSPRFTLEKLLDGTYTRQLHDYYSDQINLAILWLNSKLSLNLPWAKMRTTEFCLAGKDI